jgi:hypothetical protein
MNAQWSAKRIQRLQDHLNVSIVTSRDDDDERDIDVHQHLSIRIQPLQQSQQQLSSGLLQCLSNAKVNAQKEPHDDDDNNNQLDFDDDDVELVIGDDVRLRLVRPLRIDLVPHQLVSPSWLGLDRNCQTQELLEHLRWMVQKESLQQDMMLLGEPGPMRRWLALFFCQLTQREVEYVSLSRDTTESDLKQRREIQRRSSLWVNQACVNAALNGRVLLLDGLEKCESNVLPVLNNLLENR